MEKTPGRSLSLQKKTTHPNQPDEIIQDILSRLPSRDILRCRCVSKSWLSLISDPSLFKLHSTRITDHGLFMVAYDRSNFNQYLLSASPYGGAITHLLTIPNASPQIHSSALSKHINGLVFLTSENGLSPKKNSYLLNPSTRKIFEIHAADPKKDHASLGVFYMFGFDDELNEHKILHIRVPDVLSLRLFKPSMAEFAIFSLSNYSWRKINTQLPNDIYVHGWFWGMKKPSNVCVNSVIYSMISDVNQILVFNLRTELFSMTRLPDNAILLKASTYFKHDGVFYEKHNTPLLMKLNGSLAVVCHERVVYENIMEIWILKDHKNQHWVKETVIFPAPWLGLGQPYPTDTTQTGEIIFTPHRLSMDVVSILIYDMSKRTFRSAEVTLGHESLRLEAVEIRQVAGYVESIMPLPKTQLQSMCESLPSKGKGRKKNLTSSKSSATMT